ncbi:MULTISPECIES: hypothetical protein [Flavobacterium]|uniref:PH domain-containing protein n=1 Tax=Flavobacterium quisquiliarum TaxID=1834436 RepID=A0ABV8W8G2_9FLAO|nr:MULTISPECIES: hypothetical protein [Flavobacterium]MBW1656651.1 hypothetical protein [Flavobacterium quisquiliarum]MDQ6531172.1 hypothetical protein [Flavobacterium sp. LHD-85]
MTTNSFTLPDKYLVKKSQINGKINALKGDYIATQTKDGTAYTIDFEDDFNGEEFKKWLVDLIPDIHEF